MLHSLRLVAKLLIRNYSFFFAFHSFESTLSTLDIKFIFLDNILDHEYILYQFRNNQNQIKQLIMLLSQYNPI